MAGPVSPRARAWLLACLLASAPAAFAAPPPDPAATTAPAGTDASAAPGAARPLPASGYTWQPELAPQGPVLVLVSLSEQRARVYRNGVRIAEATVSTGRPGYETPPGVYTILQKAREHRSNLYDDAPMPFMQRLTWDGIALHEGRVPGYPASHGCVRLPGGFAEALFGLTTRGMTVVIVEASDGPALLASPPLAPPPAALATPREALAQPRLLEPGHAWTPERAPEGAMTLVLGTRERELVVLRQGIEIGRGPVQLPDEVGEGLRAWVLLEGIDASAPGLDPQRPRRRWAQVAGPPGPDPLAGRVGVAPGFAARIYDALRPGDTVVVTDEPVARGRATVLDAESPLPDEPRSGSGDGPSP